MRKIVVAVLAFLVVAGVGWELTHPSERDPRNVKYLLWKSGLCRMNLDSATGTMIGDPSRNGLVVGKTRAQLRERFEYLLVPADAGPYLRACYQSSSWKDRDVLFILKSSWMVVFDGDKAAELVLIKGC
jgi:hypothetical protein